MGFNDWINIESSPMALDNRLSEIDEEAKNVLAGEIQTRVRGRVDPGIDLKSARRAQKIRAQASGGQIIIDEEDQAAVLRGGSAPQRDISEARAGGMADLFTMSSGVPDMARAQDGSNQMVFRTIAAKDLFAKQEQDEQNRVVQNTVTDTIRSGIVDAFDEATKKIEQRYPEDKLR